ncbi:hypothetical protein HUI95_03195 [Aeromonas dhakensis]|uniref:hypothetical protein n=1 Tax=Aeromonas dhakensis TaxID=196024 RepID=UPI001A8E3E7F|nr:hypothetical protein [Aeromonas dhakensis]QSR42107.1 hypothetical protein HUI95_03195 [Aeromonas dhakensis]
MKLKVVIGVIFILMSITIYKLVSLTLILISSSPVMLSPNGFYVYNSAPDRGHVSVEGTWYIKEQKQAFPLQVSTIECHGQTNSCTGSTAIVMSGNMLHTFIDNFKILKWDKNQISIVDNSPMCFDYLYTIDLSQEKMTGKRVLKNNSASCSGMEQTLHMELRNGIDAEFLYVKEKESKLWVNLKHIFLLLINPLV